MGPHRLFLPTLTISITSGYPMSNPPAGGLDPRWKNGRPKKQGCKPRRFNIAKHRPTQEFFPSSRSTNRCTVLVARTVGVIYELYCRCSRHYMRVVAVLVILRTLAALVVLRTVAVSSFYELSLFRRSTNCRCSRRLPTSCRCLRFEVHF